MKTTAFIRLFNPATSPEDTTTGSPGGSPPPGTMPAGAAFEKIELHGTSTPAGAPTASAPVGKQTFNAKVEVTAEPGNPATPPFPQMPWPMNRSSMMGGMGQLMQSAKRVVTLLAALLVAAFLGYAVFALVTAPPHDQHIELEVHKPLDAGIFSRWSFNSDYEKRTIIDRNAVTGDTRVQLIDSKGRRYIPGREGWKRVDE